MVFKINDFQPMKPSPNTVTALPDVVSGKRWSVHTHNYEITIH